MKKLYCFLIAFLAIFVYSCTNSQFTNPSQYIRYAESVNGGGSSGSGGGKVIYHTLAINMLGDGQVRVDGKEYKEELKFKKNTKIKIEAIAAFGNQFKEWGGSVSSKQKTEEIVMDSDKSIVASFIDPKDKKILFINIGKHGSVEIVGDKIYENYTDIMMTIKKEYDSLSSVKLKAKPENDTFAFAGWSGNIEPTDVNKEEIEVQLGGISTVLASFDPEEKVLAISATEWGYVEVTVNTEPAIKYSDVMYIQKGSKVKIEAIEKDNNTRKYKFVRWSGSMLSGDKIITINNFNSDISLIAEFEQVMRKLTIDTPTQGQAMEYKVNGDLYMGATDYPIDSDLSIEAIEKYYPFVSWSGDASGTSKITNVLLDDNKTIKASFQTGVFDTYDNPNLNGYASSAFDTWVVVVPTFGSEEIPEYTFNESYKWGGTTLENGIEMRTYKGDDSYALIAGISPMNYFMYKGANYYMNRDKGSSDPYNSGLHANILKRFHFYRFEGTSAGQSLNNSLCVVDTYTKLIWAYAVPTEFKAILGNAVPQRWEAVEVVAKSKLNYDYKFYEYDPIGYVDDQGKVVLFESFKKIQRAGASIKPHWLTGKMDTEKKIKSYLAGEPSGGTATIDFASLNTAGGNRSPYY